MKDEAFVRHMIDSINKIEEYTEDMNFEKFEEDTMRQDAIIREIEILGEAAKRLSDDIRDRYTEIPWKDVAGMRDKLIHGYFGVDVEIVWNTVKKDLPDFKKNLLELKEKEF